jgi:hypothetical protein
MYHVSLEHPKRSDTLSSSRPATAFTGYTLKISTTDTLSSPLLLAWKKLLTRPTQANKTTMLAPHPLIFILESEPKPYTFPRLNHQFR